MKKICIFSILLMATCFTSAVAQKHNTLTAKEKKEGWILLFDGKSIDGWRQCNKTEMAKNWVIDDESMKVQKGSVPGRGSGGDILFATIVANFKNRRNDCHLLQ
jgi:hypothetical protein